MLLLSFNLAIFCLTLTAILFMVFGIIFVVTGFTFKDKDGHLDSGKITRGFVLFTIGLVLTPAFCDGVYSAFREEAESGDRFLRGGWLIYLLAWPLILTIFAGVIVFYFVYGSHCLRTGKYNIKKRELQDLDTVIFGYMLFTFGAMFALSGIMLLISSFIPA